MSNASWITEAICCGRSQLAQVFHQNSEYIIGLIGKNDYYKVFPKSSQSAAAGTIVDCQVRGS